jgi:nitrite reductase (NADH) large subunit
MNSNVAALNKLQTLIVIGNGMVGHHCVEQLIERGALDHYRLHVFSEEPMRAYDRVHLSEYFTGRDAESLALSDAALYQTPGVTLHLGVPVLEIDRARRQVITAQGCVAYDKLVLATGSYPFVPPVPGADHARCLTNVAFGKARDLAALKSARLVSYTYFPKSKTNVYAGLPGDVSPLDAKVVEAMIGALKTGFYYLWLPQTR